MKTRTRFIVATFALLVALAVLFVPLPQRLRFDTRIVSTASIQRPPPVVFDYVTTPAHWPDWHPSSLAVSGTVDHPLDVDEQVTEAFSVAGRRGQVVWTVAQRVRPSRWVIAGKIDGRAAGTVSYSLSPTVDGTAFEREFTYRAPSLWFAVLNWAVLRGRIQSESDTAVLRLKGRLEASSQQ